MKQHNTILVPFLLQTPSSLLLLPFPSPFFLLFLQPLVKHRRLLLDVFPAFCFWKSVVLNTNLSATAIATVTQIAELRTTENMTLKGRRF